MGVCVDIRKFLLTSALYLSMGAAVVPAVDALDAASVRSDAGNGELRRDGSADTDEEIRPAAPGQDA